nr:hypothetical protein GCM10020185_05740 [Pseudomonas brassicacearum subsp. brassicacearum]
MLTADKRLANLLVDVGHIIRRTIQHVRQLAKRFQILQGTIIELAPLEEFQNPLPYVRLLEFVEDPDIGVFFAR